jgi:hypothetical protein
MVALQANLLLAVITSGKLAKFDLAMVHYGVLGFTKFVL